MRYCVNVPNFGDYHDPDTVAGLAVDAEDAGWDDLKPSSPRLAAGPWVKPTPIRLCMMF